MKAKISKPDNGKKSSSPFFGRGVPGSFFAVQPKLKMGQPGDRYEEEADKVAERVVSEPNQDRPFFSGDGHSQSIGEKPQAESINGVQRQEEEEEEAQAKAEVQSQPMEEEEEMLQPRGEEESVQAQPEEEEEEPVQAQPLEEEEEELMPKREVTASHPGTDFETRLKASRGNGSPMDADTRSRMEAGFGADFSGVRIHTDSHAVQMNRELSAQAFTSGKDIYFNEGKYHPGSQSGRKLLAHELTHTVQQGGAATQNTIHKWPWSRSLEERKREFRSRFYGPITYTQRRGAGSGFEASYSPVRNRLNITVRGKIRFADTLVGSGGSYSSPNVFMNRAGFIPIMNSLPAEVQARILPFFQWTEEEKQIHLIRFQQNLTAAANLWQNTGMSLQVDETGWEDVTAVPNINLDITEGEARHRTETRSFWGISYNVTNESTSDHVQVEIVKQPSVADVAEIRRIITEYSAARGASVTSGMVRGVRSYQGNDPGSRRSAPEGFNNLMSLESDRSDDPNTKKYGWTVGFEHNDSTLTEAARAGLDGFFSNPMILLDNSGRGVDISLTGYASAPGTTEYNRSLVESRLNTVENYIDNRIINSDISTNVWTVGRTNESDIPAETDRATNPATHDPASFRKVEIKVVREGRGGQNVFAHELGHVFGLGDEYVSSARRAGTRARHHRLARRAGVTAGARVANDSRMMSTGNVVGAAHYATFADALRRLTSKRWKIIS